MFLKRFVFVNWGNIPSLEFELGPVNLFSGANGSGKTTAADAIQTIMTAAHENLFQYNPGQDETTQRGRGGKRVRTLASYVLGCDDGSYARLDATDGYLAAVFHPTQGENAEPFTAIIGVRAWLEHAGGNSTARQEDVQFFMLQGEQLALAHLVKQHNEGRQVIPLDRLQNLLIGEFGKRTVEKYDTKKGYLRRLYGALQGRIDAVTEQEAVSAARAFSRFMAYRPVKSIDRFVAGEILEKKDLGEAIRSVSSQLKTIHSMERDAGRLVDSIRVLEQAKNHSQMYIEYWIELNILDYSLVQHGFYQRQKEYLTARESQRSHKREQRRLQDDIARLRQSRDDAHERLLNLEAQRLGIPALQQKDELEARLGELDRLLMETSRQALEQAQQLERNLSCSESLLRALQDVNDDLAAAVDIDTAAIGRKFLQQGRHGDLDLPSLLQRDITGDIRSLEQLLERARHIQQQHNEWLSHWFDTDSEHENRRDRLSRLAHEQEGQYRQFSAQRQQKRKEIERLEAHQVSYPVYVERALDAIRRQIPAADPRVLCDHVEVRDPNWQSAIEGYLGGARFSIIVAADYEAEAIGIVRTMRGRDNRARVIQGHKAARDTARLKLDSESIVHVLEFTHAVARDYFHASYGGVLRVTSTEALRQTRRGLTEEGIGAGNYSMWRCDIPDGELVFGATARQRALKAKHTEYEAIEIGWRGANDRMQRSSGMLRDVDGLRRVAYAEVFSAMLTNHRQQSKLQGLLEQLDLGEHETLERKLAILKQEEGDQTRQWEAVSQKLGEVSQRLEESNQQCRKLGEAQEHNQSLVEQHENNLRDITTVWPDFEFETRLNAADLEARDLDLQSAEVEHETVESNLRNTERQMGDALNRHNQHCRPGDAVVYSGFTGGYDSDLFAHICDLQREIDRIFNILKNNILVDKHQQLQQLKLSFNNAFVTHLCHAIHQAINEGRRQIEQLNKELTHHHFGTDRETFRFAGKWLPEFRDYARFFEEVIRNPAIGDEVSLFDAELSEGSRKVRERLMAMLLNEDEHKAFRELERIADYRNYHRYEIYKEVEGKPPIALSEYGTGSGGQLETPAYIIRSAAITSAFRFAEGSNHLRMVLVDEAFSKMDEARSREVIGYLTQSLGLQLVFIMPTNKCGPYMDLISNEFVFAKCPSEQARGQLNTRVLVDRKRCNQQRITDLWANHRRAIHYQAEMDFMQEFQE